MESHDTALESELRQALLAAAEPVHGDGVREDAVRRTVARRRRTRRTVRLSLAGAAAAAVAVALLVSLASSGDDHDSMRTVDRSPSTSSATTTAPDRPDRNEPSATSSTTAGDSTATSTPRTSTTPSTAASNTSPTPTTTQAPRSPEFPPEFTDLTQGGGAWALYLAVAAAGQYDAPELRAADAARAEAGYRSGGGFGELACDQGAPEALGRDGSSLAATVYFQTQAQAQQARTAFQTRGHAVVGVVHVRTYCLD